MSINFKKLWLVAFALLILIVSAIVTVPTHASNNIERQSSINVPAITDTPTATATPLYSLGNHVWFDTNNNGVINLPNEVGVDGVTVNLYFASDLTTIIATDTTINGGYYLFDGLAAGDYVVAVASSNFDTGGALKGDWSSGTSRTITGARTETPAPAANGNIDSDDNGTLQTSGITGAVTSSVITLGPGASEPTGETDVNGGQGQPDAYANMTVDFGFYTISLGDLVWNDLDNSGQVNGSEAGLDDVIVELWSADGSSSLGTTFTAGGGLYRFDGLPAGDYIVRLPAANFTPSGILRDYRSSTGQLPALVYEPAPDADTNTTNADDNGTETNGLLGLGGYVETLPVTLVAAAEQSVTPAMGSTLESRVDFGVNNSPQIDLIVTKTDGQAFYLPGGTLNYSIVVTNNGPADATNMTVSDALPAQITSWAWTCAAGTPVGYQCTDAASSTATFTDMLDLPQLASVTYNVVAQLSPSATGNLTNAVSVFPPSGMTDLTPHDNTATDLDLSPITVAINQAAGQADPATVSPIHFTAVFSEGVTGFTAKDIDFTGSTLTGTLLATITEIAPNNGTTYDVAITGMIPKGTVFVSIPALSVDSISHLGVANQASTSTDNHVIFDYVLAEFASNAANDGWLLESGETSGLGGSKNDLATTLSLGDDASNRQYRSVVDFNTASLPDNAVIYAVNLRMIQSGIVGTNPFKTHGALRAEIKTGFFGTGSALENLDFQSAANRLACNFETVPEIIESLGTAYRCIVLQAAFPYISRTSTTQLRLRFTLDDNNDMSADIFNFYSGNFSNTSQRPRLFIKYYIPVP